MSAQSLELVIAPERVAVARLDPGAGPPDWARGSGFRSLTWTADELSVVCDQTRVPGGVRAERGFRRLTVAGPLEFSVVGVLAALTAPLAEVGVSVFTISTFDTDHLLVREAALARVREALEAAGHRVVAQPGAEQR